LLKNGNSNESHGQNSGEQFGYGAYRYGQYGDVQAQYGTFDYNQFGEVHTQPNWIHRYYSLLGEIVRSSKEIYDYHVHNYNTNYMGSMTWFDYCTLVDRRTQFQHARNSCWM
jgi:hypothetical protein